MGYPELARTRQREAAAWVARFDLLREHLGDEEFNSMSIAEKKREWVDLDARNRAREQRERGLARLAEMKREAEERAQDTGRERRARLQTNLESRYQAGRLQDYQILLEMRRDSEKLVMQVVGTSDLPPQPVERASAIKELSQPLQIHSPNVREKMANDAASIEEAKPKKNWAAKETSKGTKKREAPSSAEPYEGFHKRQQHLETRQRQIRLLREERQSMKEPPAKKLKASHPTPPQAPPNTDTGRTPSPEAAAESQKPTAPVTPAPKRKASGPASAKTAKKPRGPGRPKKEATAPEPASLLSPPHTSGSEPSVSPKQKQREPETQQQQQAASASSAPPTEPSKATALANAPITASSLKKIPPKPTGAIKAATGARKTTKAPRVANAASSAAPAELAPAATTTKVPLTTSAPTKAPPKPVSAARKPARPRKATSAPSAAQPNTKAAEAGTPKATTTTTPRATPPPPLPTTTTLPPHHYLAMPLLDRQYGSLSYVIRMSPADYSLLLQAPLERDVVKRPAPLLESSSLKEATPIPGTESYRDLDIGYCFPLRGPKGEMPRLRQVEDEEKEGYYWVEVRGLGVIEKGKVVVPERWDDPWALAVLKEEEGCFEESDYDSDSDC